MLTSNSISLFIMAAIYCIAGLSHFRNPNIYLKITPKWVPYPRITNIIVGSLEIILACALLFSNTRRLAAMGIIALLIAVFPANICHYQQAKAKRKYVIATFIRLPVQILLIYWAYTFI